MKNIQDLLKQKEAELEKVQRELEALRIVARLLQDGTETVTANVMPIPATAGVPIAAMQRTTKSIGRTISEMETRQFP